MKPRPFIVIDDPHTTYFMGVDLATGPDFTAIMRSGGVMEIRQTPFVERDLLADLVLPEVQAPRGRSFASRYGELCCMLAFARRFR